MVASLDIAHAAQSVSMQGVAMVFFTFGRMQRHGWSAWQVCKHYIIRGVLLLFIGRLVNPPFYVDKIVDKYYNRHGVQRHGSLHESLWFAAWISVFEVMTGLGLVMLVAGILMPVVYKCREMRVQLLTPRDTGCPVVHCLLLVCSFGLFALSNALLVHYQDGDPENTLNTGGWQRAIAVEWWQILLRCVICFPVF